MQRIWRYYKAPYNHNPDLECSKTIETAWCDQLYTDEILTDIAGNGFNGIWLDAHLYDLVRHAEFPEFGLFAEQHIEALSRLIDKAAKHGIKVWLCMQPGRGVSENDHAFWEKHSDIAGTRHPIHTKSWGAKGDKEYTEIISLCTSTAPVKRYLEEAFAELGKCLPGLGGCILITASEFPAHCFTFRQSAEKTCPRCEARRIVNVISEVVTLAAQGLRSTNPQAEIIAWDWGWGEHAPDIVPELPKDVILMPNFESGCRRTVCGRENVLINEYSLSCPGPSPRFVKEIEQAEKQGMRWMARLQLGTTHELATVSNLPVLATLFEKASFLRKRRSAGFMGCWNFGNMFSANTSAFNFFLSDKAPEDCHQALCAFAKQYFVGADEEKAAQAWESLSQALSNYYPFDNDFMYVGPVNWSAGYFSPPGPMQGKGGLSFSCRLGNERGDDFSGAFEKFSLQEILPYMEKLADAWEKGAALLDEALENATCAHAEEELSAVHTASAVFRSTCHLLRIVQMKQEQGAASGPAYAEIQRKELDNVEKLLPYLERDARQGFHAEARAYLFDANRVREKITRLKEYLKNH